jgi:pimeloyl-ACP methyl ester carboxylesterase
MGFIKARGSNFYYEEQGDGPPVLLIPPAGSTASTWGTLVGDLAGVGRVIAYDRRGYARSGGEVVRSAAEHTRDAASVLDAAETLLRWVYSYRAAPPATSSGRWAPT